MTSKLGILKGGKRVKKIALTLRLPEDIYKEAKQIATERGESFSSFVRNVLKEKLKEERKKKLFEAFSLVAEDKEEANVEYAFEAQRQVVVEE